MRPESKILDGFTRRGHEIFPLETFKTIAGSQVGETTLVWPCLKAGDRIRRWVCSLYKYNFIGKKIVKTLIK